MTTDRDTDVPSAARHTIWHHTDRAEFLTAAGAVDPEHVHQQTLKVHPGVTLDQVVRVMDEARYCQQRSSTPLESS